jgi:hypothetical protein
MYFLQPARLVWRTEVSFPTPAAILFYATSFRPKLRSSQPAIYQFLLNNYNFYLRQNDRREKVPSMFRSCKSPMDSDYDSTRRMPFFTPLKLCRPTWSDICCRRLLLAAFVWTEQLGNWRGRQEHTLEGWRNSSREGQRVSIHEASLWCLNIVSSVDSMALFLCRSVRLLGFWFVHNFQRLSF